MYMPSAVKFTRIECIGSQFSYMSESTVLQDKRTSIIMLTFLTNVLRTVTMHQGLTIFIFKNKKPTNILGSDCGKGDIAWELG